MSIYRYRIPLPVKFILFPVLMGYFWAVVYSLFREMGRPGNPYQPTPTVPMPVVFAIDQVSTL
jgi:hypothetical protein